MRSLRNANGKALLATWAEIRTDGSIVPVQRAAMCGDAMEWCFAVRVPPDSLQDARRGGATSWAAPILGAHTFYLFQLWETAEEVFGVLKECAIDAGDPGVDREFGLGIPDGNLRNDSKQGGTDGKRVSLCLRRISSCLVPSLRTGKFLLSGIGSEFLFLSHGEKLPISSCLSQRSRWERTVQRGKTTLSALTGVGYAPLGVRSSLAHSGHAFFAEAGVSRQVLSRKSSSLSFLAAAGAERGGIDAVSVRAGAAFRHRLVSFYGGAVYQPVVEARIRKSMGMCTCHLVTGSTNDESG